MDKKKKPAEPPRRRSVSTAQLSPLVVSSNDLVHAKYSMSLWQKRLFAYAVSQIRREDREFGYLRIYYSELLNYYEASGGKKAYDAIREAPKQLDATIEVPYRDEEGYFRYAYLKLLSGYTVAGDDGERNQYVELKFNDDLRDHLLALRERFLSYELENVRRLRSVYSIRIFELLKSHQFQHSVEFRVDYLREILQITDAYKLYSDFRRNVIDKAQKDLAESCDIYFQYQEIKRANKVEAIRFSIFSQEGRWQKIEAEKSRASKTAASEARNPKSEIQNRVGEEAEKAASASAFELLVVGEWGVSKSVFDSILKENGEKAIERAVRVTQRRAASGEVESKAAFFVAAAKKGFMDETELRSEKRKKAEAAAPRIAHLEQQSAELSQTFGKRLFGITAELTSSDARVTERAIEALQKSSHPLVRSKIAALGTDATIDDYRRDEYLRERVLDEIIRQNPVHFDPVYREFQEKQLEIEAELKRLRLG